MIQILNIPMCKIVHGYYDFIFFRRKGRTFTRASFITLYLISHNISSPGSIHKTKIVRKIHLDSIQLLKLLVWASVHIRPMTIALDIVCAKKYFNDLHYHSSKQSSGPWSPVASTTYTCPSVSISAEFWVFFCGGPGKKSSLVTYYKFNLKKKLSKCRERSLQYPSINLPPVSIYLIYLPILLNQL